jgi:hypothetical protein
VNCNQPTLRIPDKNPESDRARPSAIGFEVFLTKDYFPPRPNRSSCNTAHYGA